VSFLPTFKAPKGVLMPTKLLRESRAPVTAVLAGLMVSLLPLGLLPGVAATSTCASSWNTAWKSGLPMSW